MLIGLVVEEESIYKGMKFRLCFFDLNLFDFRAKKCGGKIGIFKETCRLEGTENLM